MPTITYQDTQEPAQTNDNNIDAQSSGQTLQQEMCTSEPTELDALLQNIMKPDTQSQLLEKQKSLASSKRPRNK